MRGARGRLLQTLLAIVVVLILHEIAARMYLQYWADDEHFIRYASTNQALARYENADPPRFRNAPHRYLGHYPTPNFTAGNDRHNALGFRGEEIELPKPEGEYRIVCLGGSTTYTGWVDDARLTYPALLQTDLNDRGYAVTVVNAGHEAWTSYETVINMAFRVIDLDPDMIIVYLGVNDIIARMVWPPEAFRGDNAGFRGPNMPQQSVLGLFEYSTFLRMILIKAGWSEPQTSLFKTLDHHASTFRGFAWRKGQLHERNALRIRGEVSGRTMLETNPPRYFERNLESIVALANHRGIDVVFATFAYFPGFKGEPLVNLEEILWAYEESNDVVRRVATKNDVSLFDFANVFPKESTLFADGIHMTKAGARVKAELFADFLVDHQLILRP